MKRYEKNLKLLRVNAGGEKTRPGQTDLKSKRQIDESEKWTFFIKERAVTVRHNRNKKYTLKIPPNIFINSRKSTKKKAITCEVDISFAAELLLLLFETKKKKVFWRF